MLIVLIKNDFIINMNILLNAPEFGVRKLIFFITKNAHHD